MSENKSSKWPFIGGLFAGLVSGLILAPHWRGVAKGGIKAGIRAGRNLKEFSQKAMEELEDVTAEAAAELAQEEEAVR